MPIDALRARTTFTRETSSHPETTAERSRGAPPPAPHDDAWLALFDRAPATSGLVAGATVLQARRSDAVAPTTTQEGRVQANLDAFRARFSGPYSIDGRRVQARPMFNMNLPNAFNAASRARHAPELARLCAEAKVSTSALRCAQVGRPTPEQLVVVTQALIDAGKLPPGPAGTEEARIRRMQWEWGIGVDCAGYTALAAEAALGPAAAALTRDRMGDLYQALRGPTFRRQDVWAIRPGDVIHLDAKARGDVGHNVVVYDRRVVDGATGRASTTGEAAPFFMSGVGPFHVLTVDSSWGAGPEGKDYGGFRRDTWLYDEGTKAWASFDPETRALSVSREGPQDEIFRGAFRPSLAR